MTSYKMRDDSSTNAYYAWHKEEGFTPSSLRVSGSGLETLNIATPLDEQDTILTEFKNPKTSTDVAEKEIKDLVSPSLVDQQLEVVSIKSTNNRTVIVKTHPVSVTRMKSIIDGLISLKSTTTAII